MEVLFEPTDEDAFDGMTHDNDSIFDQATSTAGSMAGQAGAAIASTVDSALGSAGSTMESALGSAGSTMDAAMEDAMDSAGGVIDSVGGTVSGAAQVRACRQGRVCGWCACVGVRVCGCAGEGLCVALGHCSCSPCVCCLPPQPTRPADLPPADPVRVSYACRRAWMPPRMRWTRSLAEVGWAAHLSARVSRWRAVARITCPCRDACLLSPMHRPPPSPPLLPAPQQRAGIWSKAVAQHPTVQAVPAPPGVPQVLSETCPELERCKSSMPRAH